MKDLNEFRAESARELDPDDKLNQLEPRKDQRKQSGQIVGRGVQRYPPERDGVAILRGLAQVEQELAKLDFDSTKYDEEASRSKLDKLAKSLAKKGVPRSIIEAGLRQPKADLGRKGLRHIFHWNAQKPVHNRRIQRSFARMKSLVAPVAAAQDRLPKAIGGRDQLRAELKTGKEELAKLKDRKAGLESHGIAMGLDSSAKGQLEDINRQLADRSTSSIDRTWLKQKKAEIEKRAMAEGLGKYTREELASVDKQIADLEPKIELTSKALEEADQEITQLEALIDKFDGDQISTTSHFGRVQAGLDRIGDDEAFVRTYDKINPGARRSRLKGYLAEKFAHPIKSFAKKVAGIVTLTVSSILLGWRGAIKTQDKARRFATAQHHLPTPAARMMAAVLLDRFDAEAYKKGLGAALATAHLPLAVHIPGVYDLASGPVAGALASSATVHVHAELGREFAKEGVSEAFGTGKEQVIDPASERATEKYGGHSEAQPFPMPTVPITMRGDDKPKRVDLTDKKTCLALLVHLGPAVDKQKIREGNKEEIARRDLRREIFHAGDDEDFGPKAPKRTREEKAFDKQLKKALFDPAHENRDDILRKASPMRKMFAAAGML